MNIYVELSIFQKTLSLQKMLYSFAFQLPFFQLKGSRGHNPVDYMVCVLTPFPFFSLQKWVEGKLDIALGREHGD